MKLALLLGSSALVCCAGAWFQPEYFRRAWRIFERALSTLGGRPKLAVLLVFIFSFALNAGITGWLGVSSPHIHDEFANLLAADTFAHGRLANPPHPLWPFFETVHTLMQPTYASKYPPAQGLMLATGQVMFGAPVAGMWLSVALACAAICWALQAWLPPRWALFGGLLAALHPVMLKWGQVYWGGAEAMLGGALLTGAFCRLVGAPRMRDSFWLGVGAAVLGMSRPFEGLVLCFLLGMALLWSFVKRWQEIRVLWFPLAVPFVAVLVVFVAGQLAYNKAVTGHPLRMPYMVYQEQYAVAGLFVWSKPKPEPHFNHPFFHRYTQEFELADFNRQQTLAGYWHEVWSVKIKQQLAGAFLWHHLLVVPLLALPWIVRRRGWWRFVAGASAAFVAILCTETWMFDRYAAPIITLFLLLVVEGFRHVQLLRWQRRPVGKMLVVLVLAGCLVESGLAMKRRQWDYALHDWGWQRQQMIAQLQQQGGRHLIFVRYGPLESVHNNWVNNGADIDGSPVVWAWDMGAEQNQKLIQYYPDRTVWLVEANNAFEPEDPKDVLPAKLSPYR